MRPLAVGAETVIGDRKSMSKLLQRKPVVPVNRRPKPVSAPPRGAWWPPRRSPRILPHPRRSRPPPWTARPPRSSPGSMPIRAATYRPSPASSFLHFSFYLSFSPSPSYYSLPRAATAWPHERCTNVHECPCTGRWNLFHSHRTLVLALDTDPGVVPNQKQGAKRVLKHIN